jgi:carbonic anhydrase
MPGFGQLLEGWRRFRSGAWIEQRQCHDARANKRQSPEVMVIACCDSRVDPTRVFDTQPGQALVLRNIANLVPPYCPDGARHGASAAIEYAVTALKVHHVVIFGHAHCGGIQASLDGTFDDAREASGGFIGSWMAMIAPARDRIRAAAAVSPDRCRGRTRARKHPHRHRKSAQFPLRRRRRSCREIADRGHLFRYRRRHPAGARSR